MLIDLMTRTNDGLEITLYWDNETTSPVLYVEVKDKKEGDEFMIPCKGDEAMQVYEHPFAYRAPEYVPSIWEREHNG